MLLVSLLIIWKVILTNHILSGHLVIQVKMCKWLLSLWLLKERNQPSAWATIFRWQDCLKDRTCFTIISNKDLHRYIWLYSPTFFLSNFDPKLKHMSWFQVTNPAIDPLREGLVMSLEVNIGKRGNILELGPENASQVLTLLITSPRFYPILFHTISTYVLVLFFMNQVILSNPVLNEGALEELMKDTYLKPKVLSTYFDIRKGVEGSLQKALYSLCEAADDAVRSGSQLLVLSDRSDSLVKCLKVSSQKISLCQSKSAPSYIKISGNFALSGTNPPCNSDNVSCWRCPSTSYSERFEDVSFHCC